MNSSTEASAVIYAFDDCPITTTTTISSSIVFDVAQDDHQDDDDFRQEFRPNSTKFDNCDVESDRIQCIRSHQNQSTRSHQNHNHCHHRYRHRDSVKLNQKNLKHFKRNQNDLIVDSSSKQRLNSNNYEHTKRFESIRTDSNRFDQSDSVRSDRSKPKVVVNPIADNFFDLSDQNLDRIDLNAPRSMILESSSQSNKQSIVVIIDSEEINQDKNTDPNDEDDQSSLMQTRSSISGSNQSDDDNRIDQNHHNTISGVMNSKSEEKHCRLLPLPSTRSSSSPTMVSSISASASIATTNPQQFRVHPKESMESKRERKAAKTLAIITGKFRSK